jgi:hypothetical protein
MYMSKFTPKKVSDDTSPTGQKKSVGRQDAYGSMRPGEKYEVDRYIDRRDRAAREIDRAEKDIDTVIKRAKGKTGESPSVIICDPNEQTLDLDLPGEE